MGLRFGNPENFWEPLRRTYSAVTRDPMRVDALGWIAAERGWLAAVPSTDWALGRPATLSSQFSERSALRSLDAEAGLGNDGVVTDGSGFHTDKQACPWWQVDLERLVEIDRVVLHHRRANRDRTTRLQLLVSDDGKAWRTVFIKDDASTFGSEAERSTFSPEPVVGPLVASVRRTNGRYVRVALLTDQYLHLDQVEVFGRLAA